LRSPELGDHLQKVGTYIRFKSTMGARLNEFAILITARQWTS
jgi:4-carboxymuconolactone decarboxylase